MRVFFEDYGCSLNKADSYILRALMKKAGHEFVSYESSEVVVVNSCGVKLSTENKIIDRIRKFIKDGKKVVVAGCLPRINQKRLEKLNVVMLDPNALDKINEALESEPPARFFSKKPVDKLKFPHDYGDSVNAVVEISEGCLGNCAFCGTKNARPFLKSFEINDIVNAVECLVKSGKKEIFLTSQDAGCYGFDLGVDLVELLSKVSKVKGKFRIRVGMMSPYLAVKLIDGLLEVFERDERFYRFFHFPIQSGSLKVLKRMNRKDSPEDFEFLVRKVREKFPHAVVSTDIIVGFPGETEEDFEKTEELILKTKPDVVNVSMFYPRPNTKAAEFKKLPTKIVKKRSERLSSLCRSISLEKNKEYVGEVFEVLVVGKSKKGQVLARAHNFKQVILEEGVPGDFLKVRVVSAGPSHLKAVIEK